MNITPKKPKLSPVAKFHKLFKRLQLIRPNVMCSLRKVVCLRRIVNNESANIFLLVLIPKPGLASLVFEQNSGTERLFLVLD